MDLGDLVFWDDNSCADILINLGVKNMIEFFIYSTYLIVLG